MKTRLTGLGLVVIGILAAYFFVYMPVRDGPDGVMGSLRMSALIFVPLSIVTGMAFAIGGNPVLWAFQARPKSRGQTALVLTILIGSWLISGVGFWQIKTRWLRAPEQVILDSSPRIPDLPTRDSFIQTTPAEAATTFYASYARQPFTGLPTGEHWDRIAPRVTLSLARLIVAAQAEQSRCQKAHPDDKPPWIEGDMFTSNFEGFTHFSLADSGATSGATSTMTMDFEYVNGGQRSTWRDQVVLVREYGRWVIDDVRYARREGFSNGFGESLKNALAPGGGC